MVFPGLEPTQLRFITARTPVIRPFEERLHPPQLHTSRRSTASRSTGSIDVKRKLFVASFNRAIGPQFVRENAVRKQYVHLYEKTRRPPLRGSSLDMRWEVVRMPTISTYDK